MSPEVLTAILGAAKDLSPLAITVGVGLWWIFGVKATSTPPPSTLIEYRLAAIETIIKDANLPRLRLMVEQMARKFDVGGTGK